MPRAAPAILLLVFALASAAGCQTVQPSPSNSVGQIAAEPAAPNYPVAQVGATQPAEEAGMDPHFSAATLPVMHPMGPAHELNKVVLPAYRIEPPDILVISAVQVIPRQPYQLRVGDILSVQVPGAFVEAPIAGEYPVGLGGLVNLGTPYGSVQVSNLTVEQAQEVIRKHLLQFLNEESLQLVAVALVESVGKQQIEGQHLVGPDGMVTLGTYGGVSVVGMTLAQAKMAIESHLSQFLEAPEVAVDLYALNSKVYYVVTQGGGLGDQVLRVPYTGNETVLDAISQVNGLTQVSSKQIWIARPGRNRYGCVQVMPVDWDAITKWADVQTNYQVLPGDRVFIAEDCRVAFDTDLGKTLAPFERIFGFAMLGADAVSRYSGAVLRGGGLRGAFGGGGGGP